MSSDRSDSFEFFSRLQRHIASNLPANEEMRSGIEQIVSDAQNSPDKGHLRWSEGAFLNGYIAPSIHSFLTTEEGLNPVDARRALLSESFRSLSDIASGSPARSRPHPFRKDFGETTKKAISRWMNETTLSPLTQSCPDLALREPARVKAVMEGKYFAGGGAAKATRELALAIYESFFYLALPKIEETERHPAWDYEYACLVAYDGSVDGALLEAWNRFDQSLRQGIWDGANIFVMILQGDT